MGKKIDRTLVTISIAFFLLAGIFIVKYTPTKTQFIDTEGQPIIGSHAASVQVVIFEDLNCVWCAHFSREGYPKLKEEYIDTGKVQYSIILLAFLPGSKAKANAALEINRQNPQLFFPFVEEVYKGQIPGEESSDKSDFFNDIVAKVPGINEQRILESMKMGRYNNKLKENLDLAKRVMTTQFGTPTIYINGKRIEELDYDSVKEHIEKALHD